MADAGYYAVIFSSRRTAEDEAGYEAASERMLELASVQPGFRGVESARGSDGFGITVSYWDSLEAIAAWRTQAEHLAVQEAGRRVWYERFDLRICRVERERSLP
jgi:heme-degrading monooxygenase HmoA